jgi:hypothetical protein
MAHGKAVIWEWFLSTLCHWLTTLRRPMNELLRNIDPDGSKPVLVSCDTIAAVSKFGAIAGKESHGQGVAIGARGQVGSPARI